MEGSRHGLATALALVVLISLGLPSMGLGIGADASSQPSAMERLRRQEDARKADLARFAAATTQADAATMRDVRERAMLERPSIAPTAPVEPTTRPGVVDEFDWGAAALGLGAGVAATCALLVCFALVRSPGRLRGV